MPLKFTCQHCGKRYKTDDRMRDVAIRWRCRGCGHIIEVAPGPAGSEATGSAAGPADPGRGQPGPPRGPSEVDIWSELSQELASDAPAKAPARARGPGTSLPPPSPSGDDDGGDLAVAAPLVAAPAAAAAQLGPLPEAAPPPRRRPSAILLGVVLLAGGLGGAAVWKAYPTRPAPADPMARAPSPVPAPVPASVPAPEPAAPPRSPPSPQPPGDIAVPVLAEGRTDRMPAARRAAEPPRGRDPEAKVAKPDLAYPRVEGSGAGPVTPARSGPPVAMVQGAPPPAPAPSPPASARAPPPPFDEAAVEAALAGNGREFEACLADARKAEPRIALEWEWLPVPVSLLLHPGGRASAPVVEDADLNGSELGRCIRKEAAAIEYPAFSGEPVRVRTSIQLHDRSANTHNTRRRGL